MRNQAPTKTEATSLQPAPEKPPVKQRRKSEPIVVYLEQFLLNPAHYAKMATSTKCVKVKDSSGETVCIYGGRLW